MVTVAEAIEGFKELANAHISQTVTAKDLLMKEDWQVILTGRDPGAPEYKYPSIKEAFGFARMFFPTGSTITVDGVKRTITLN